MRDRLELIRHTFALDPIAVPHTPLLYAHLNTVLKPAWFYLSASPYNLYPTLRRFVGDNFPQGQILLREMSWQEMESFVASLTIGTQKYKEGEIARLIEHLPERKWVLIGDSTQKDPEAYAAMYRKHPKAVRRIWIRLVEGVSVEEEKHLNEAERFEKAFMGVPADVWRTYKDPREMEAFVEEIV